MKTHILLIVLALQLSCTKDSRDDDKQLLTLSSYTCEFPESFEYRKPDYGIYYDRNHPVEIQIFSVDRPLLPDQIDNVKVRLLKSGEINGIHYKSREYTSGRTPPMTYHSATIDGIPVGLSGDWETFETFLDSCKK